MSPKRSIKLLTAVACIALTVSQIPNFIYMWNRYRSVRYARLEHGYYSLKMPDRLMGELIADADPETTVVTRVIFGRDNNVESIAALVRKYPQNDLLISELLSYIVVDASLDPAFADALSDILLSRNPDNAHFHYLKANVRTAANRTDNTQQLLDRLKRAEDFNVIDSPLDRWQPKVIEMFESRRINPFYYGVYLNVDDQYRLRYDLCNNLRNRAQLVRSRGDSLLAGRIDDASNAVVRRYLEDVNDPYSRAFSIRQTRDSLMSKLQIGDASPSQLRDIRFKLAALVESIHLRRERLRRLYPDDSLLLPILAGGFLAGCAVLAFAAVSILILTVQLTAPRAACAPLRISSRLLFVLACGLFLAVLFLAGLVRYELAGLSSHRDPPDRTAAWAIAVAAAVAWMLLWIASLMNVRVKLPAAILKRIVIVVIVISAALLGASYLVNRDLAGGLLIRICIIAALAPSALMLTVIGAATMMAMLPARIIFQNRYTQIILTTVFFACLCILAPNGWIRLAAAALFILAISLIVVAEPTAKTPAVIAGLARLPARTTGACAIRSAILSLLWPCIVICLLVLLIGTHYGARTIRLQRIWMLSPEEFSLWQPVTPDEQTYRRVLDRFTSDDPDAPPLRRNLYLIEPNDLSEILRSARGRRLSDDDLIYAASRCGPDAVTVLIDNLMNPDSSDALIMRAGRGDLTALPLLEDTLKSKMQMAFHNFDPNGQTPPPSLDACEYYLDDCFEVLAALIPHAEPNEAADRITDLVEHAEPLWTSYDAAIADFAEPSYFHPDWEPMIFYEVAGPYDCFNRIPRAKAAAVFKAYLDKTDYRDFSGRGTPFWSSDIFAALYDHCDTEIATRIMNLIAEHTLTGPENTRETTGAAAPSQDVIDETLDGFTADSGLLKVIARHVDSSSAELLAEYLTAADPDLRAFCVLHLSRLGYEFSSDQIDRLMTDPNWIVRANIIAAARITTPSENESSNFIKLACQLVAGDLK